MTGICQWACLSESVLFAEAFDTYCSCVCVICKNVLIKSTTFIINENILCDLKAGKTPVQTKQVIESQRHLAFMLLNSAFCKRGLKFLSTKARPQY